MEKKIFNLILLIAFILIITNACTYIICSWDQPAGESNQGAKTEVLIYIPPYETGEVCQEVNFPFTMPYYSPIYGESSRKIINNTLITSSTIYNQVPVDPYCGYQIPFEWYGIDAGNISLLYENEEIYPSKIIISPVYLESEVHEPALPMHGVTIERWYSLPEDIDLNNTKIRSNYLEYLKNRESPFKYEVHESNFSL